MHQHQDHTQNLPTLLVLSNQQKDFLQMQNLLCTYFPSARKEQIHLDTKYYLADVRIVRQGWPDASEIVLSEAEMSQQQLSNANPDDKQDLLIMLVNQDESFTAQTYDYVINKYNPQNFILIVNTKDKNMAWVDQSKIANQVNNFIEIIKEDLEMLNKNPPERTKKGLLTDSYEDGNIFNLLELIQTTPWSHITRKTFEKESKAKIQQAPNNKQTKEPEQKKEQLKPEAQFNEEQMTDQQLQSEMNAFESLMSEMMNLRAASAHPQKIPDNDRKRQAEDIMKRLVGGWM